MKAALLYGPRDLRVVEVDDPAPGPDEVTVRVVSFAPYGTDLGVYLNRGGRYPQPYPVGIGADFSGVIEKVGAAVIGWQEGDRVSALTLAHCGRCANCRAGRTNLCLDPAFTPPPRQVCCQGITTVFAPKLARLPESVTFDDAAMLGGIADALNAFDKMRPQPGETIAVVGVGAMGWGAIAAAKAFELNVVAIGGTGRRAELARRAGADDVVTIGAHDEDVKDRFLARYPAGVPLIIETSATEWGLRQSFAVAAMQGRITLTGGGALDLSGWDIVMRELEVYGSRASHHQQQALDLIAQGKIDLKPTITHRFPLRGAPEAFEQLVGPDAKDIGRVIIDCGEP
ncbi:MAG: alcohol dehydrogenase catalytic domain-containing protein [Alphaproteobacteria bacterium]|nr:alcohol dehydrogenase catalytic domain-containing protein [Alphaproteobacteria bacterium]